MIGVFVCKNTVRTRKLWNRKMTIKYFFSVIDVTTKQEVLLALFQITY